MNSHQLRLTLSSPDAARLCVPQLRLKNRFGDGYKLALSAVDALEPTLARVRAFVHGHPLMRSARETSAVGGSLTFLLPRGAVDVPGLFQVTMLLLVAGRWSLVAGRWSLVAGRWSLVAGRWSLVAGRSLPTLVDAFVYFIRRHWRRVRLPLAFESGVSPRPALKRYVTSSHFSLCL
jgi:hypothetical protein